MNYQNVFAISLHGLNQEKQRLEVVAENIANQNSIATQNHVPYHSKQLQTTPVSFEQLISAQPGELPSGNAMIIENSQENLQYQPEHPHADDKGFVHYPAVDMVEQMTTMLQAARSYEANLKMIAISKSLAMQALSIGAEK